MYLVLVIVLWVCSCAEFGAEFSTLQQERLGTKIKIGGKQVIENVDLFSSQFSICCKPNHSIFQIIHNFLSNPFFQINEYSCPPNPTPFSSAQIVLPIVGVIQMKFQLTEFPQCQRGVLGLSKKSKFLSYLPINMHAFRIQINSRVDSNIKEIKLSFGDSKQIPQDQGTFFNSPHPTYWDFTVSSVKLGELVLESNAKIVLRTSGTGLLIPSSYYNRLMRYFPTNQTCKQQNDQILCLCQSGIPTSFPQFILQLDNSKSINIPLQSYMSINSNICTLMFRPSKDQYWHFDIFLFKDTLFYFDREKSRIKIQEHILPSNSSSDLIHLPIQLILNCCVILLLCIFASMVIIQLIKRASGLSDAHEQNIRAYVLRSNFD